VHWIKRRVVLLKSAPVNVKPAYFDLIGHLKYSDIDEQWQTDQWAQMNTHTISSLFWRSLCSGAADRIFRLIFALSQELANLLDTFGRSQRFLLTAVNPIMQCSSVKLDLEWIENALSAPRQWTRTGWAAAETRACAPAKRSGAGVAKPCGAGKQALHL